MSFSAMVNERPNTAASETTPCKSLEQSRYQQNTNWEANLDSGVSPVVPSAWLREKPISVSEEYESLSNYRFQPISGCICLSRRNECYEAEMELVALGRDYV